MKFKVGDKVKVSTFESIKAKFAYGRDFSSGRRFANQMEAWCGKVVTIKIVNETSYHIHEDGGAWHWDDDMLEPVNSQKIVITTDGTETLARLYEGKKVVKTATAKCSPDDTFDFETGARIAFDRLIESPLVKALRGLREAAAGIANNIKPLKFEIGKQYADGELVIEITGANRETRKYDYKVIKGEDSGPLRFFHENSNFGTRLTPYDPPKYYNGKVVCVDRGYGNSVPIGAFTIGKVYTVENGVIVADGNYKTERYTTLDDLCVGVGHKLIPLVE